LHVVIPTEVREGLALAPPRSLQVIRKSNEILLVPTRPMATYRGILRGLATTGFREKDR
jgi:bifunctional DNA-binding transcriptional regulator/antitoxin component of YhaV-PrlF toxin-antitoxin module